MKRESLITECALFVRRAKKFTESLERADTPIRPKQLTSDLCQFFFFFVLLPFSPEFFEDELIIYLDWVNSLVLLLSAPHPLFSSLLPSSPLNFSVPLRRIPSALVASRVRAQNAQPPRMVGSTLAMRSSRMASPSAMRLSSLSRVARPLRSNGFLQQQSFQRAAARRTYADAAPAPTPTPKPKKKFRFLRWAWRLTWLTGVGLTGMLAYSIYELRHPIDQIEPDPSKKTLVILGAFYFRGGYKAKEGYVRLMRFYRYRLGFRFPVEEARH